MPLEGVRVTDFCWIGAGAFATKMLADAGADVIKIESSERLDSLRVAAPFKDRKKGINRSGYFADRNTSKRSITIDLKHPAARGMIYRLIEQSDIVANNFTPGVMERLGFGYEDVRRVKPDIIYLSMSMQGSTGPHSHYVGYGLTIASLTGLLPLCGLPGRLPAGTGTNYPDHLPNPCHAVFAVLAALRHRLRTGQGQRIDVAQTEPTIALLATAVMEYTVNGRIPGRAGNDHPYAAPHGVYPCQGTDRWIAIVVVNDAQWAGLARVLGKPHLADDPRWVSAAARHSNRKALDELVAQETVRWSAEALMEALQAAGVPAGIVQNAADLIERDPQLRHRGHWVKLDHPEMGETIYNAPPYRFSASTVKLRSPAPLLGQHTEEVARDLLGLSQDEIRTLTETGLFK